MDRQREVARRQPQRAGDGERERRLPERLRIDAEEQMVHDRVADEHRLQDLLGRRCRPGRQSRVISAPIAPRTAPVSAPRSSGLIIR